MKIGVFSLMQWPEDRSQRDVFRNELDQLTVAEEQGYDAAWLAEPRPACIPNRGRASHSRFARERGLPT